MMDSDIEDIKNKRSLADYYYDNFNKYYRTNNLSKASEFLWGTINALAYALGLFEGKKLSTHNKVRDFLIELANSYNDKEIAEGIVSAESLHANFFHDFMDDLVFEKNRSDAEKLIKKLVENLDHKIKSEL
jgi:hypothetical protein